MTFPDAIPIDAEQRDLIADRIGTSLRRGVYVLALDGFEIKGGERVLDFEDLAGVLFGITRSYPKYEIMSAFFDNNEFVFKDITPSDFDASHHPVNETDVEIAEFFKTAFGEPTLPPEPDVKE